MTRTPLRLLVLALTWALSALVLTAPAQAAAPYCGITWGSLDKQGSSGGGEITSVRAGRHDCYDRLVIDIREGSGNASWSAAYVNRVRQDPSDQALPLRGGAFLRIVLHSSDHTPDGVVTYDPANGDELVNVAGFRTFRQVALAGSFEGVTSFGLGVRARLPFRVFTLSGPGSGTRVVVDVAHLW